MRGILFSIAAGLVLVFGALLLNPWASHVATLCRWIILPPQRDEPDRRAIEKVRAALLTQTNRNIGVVALSPFAVRALSPTMIGDQIELLGNYSPPEINEYVPLRAGESIYHAYGILLRDLAAQVDARSDVDEDIKVLLRRSSVSRGKGSSKHDASLAAAIAKTLASNLTDKIRLAELLRSLDSYQAYEVSEEIYGTAERRVALPKWENNFSDFGAREERTGFFLVTGASSEGKRTLTIKAKMLGPSYFFVPFKRPGWFDIDLLRYARKASLTSARLDMYFGARGYLSRIPLGIIVTRLDSVIVETDDSNELSHLAKDSDALFLDSQDLHMQIGNRPENLPTTEKILLFDTRALSSPQVVAVVSEQI